MRLAEQYTAEVAKAAVEAEAHRAYNAALASNLYRQAQKNLCAKLGGRPVKTNGIPPRIVFPDHSYLNGTVPA